MNETRKRGRPRGSAQANDLLERLAQEGRDTIDTTVDRALLERVSGSPDALLRRLVDAGIAHRIQNGRYVVNLDARPSRRPRLEALDPLAETLLRRLDKPYYLSWHSALWHYGLIDQQSSRLFVALRHSRKPRVKLARYEIRFVSLSEKRFFGYETVHDFGVPIVMAHVEKAIIDSFAQPRLAAPVPVVANALRTAWQGELLDIDRLVKYAVDFDSVGLVRRLGFFLDLYEIPGSEALLPYIGRKSAMPLVPGTPAKGPKPHVNSKWLVYEDPLTVENARALK